ncbi:MAG: response regulator transcription factor [Pyrinomonadaceae bacterium]|nr:response regulator transcription factor [Pyrinomonadaceae bacterium]
MIEMMPGISNNQPPPTAAIKVAIIEDLREVREGLAMLINGTNGFSCVGRFRSMEDAIANLSSEPPDVVLTDIGLPGMDGIAGIKILHTKFPDLPFIALTVYDDDERIFDALCAGACGYLLKNTQPARLLESLREVMAGGAPMSPEVARRVITLFQNFTPPKNSEYHLTPQEKELLKMLIEGHSYKTAAYQLEISIHTVSFHLRNVYEKLQVHSKSEAVAKALREQIV